MGNACEDWARYALLTYILMYTFHKAAYNSLTISLDPGRRLVEYLLLANVSTTGRPWPSVAKLALKTGSQGLNPVHSP